MIDYTQPMKTAYFHRLNGNVSYNTVAVPVFKGDALSNAVYPYIIIGSQTNVSNRSKSHQGSDTTIVVDIQTGFRGGIDESVANYIANQVLLLINPADKNFVDPGTGIQVIDTDLALDRNDTMQNGDYKVYRRILTFRHIIHEKIFH